MSRADSAVLSEFRPSKEGSDSSDIGTRPDSADSDCFGHSDAGERRAGSLRAAGPRQPQKRHLRHRFARSGSVGSAPKAGKCLCEELYFVRMCLLFWLINL